MKDSPLKNVAASVRHRLLERSKQRGEDFQFVLSRYASERLLYRLSVSQYREGFVLKGALLFLLWGGELHRPTRDLDLLGFGDSSVAGLENVFRDLCATVVEDDGLVFVAESVAGGQIREDQEYGGVRVKLVAMLERAKIPVQVDIGFGDAITPAARWHNYPTLLGTPSPRLRTYPRETVVAEKLEAMVSLGMGNSRMKDFYDVAVLAQRFDFDGARLAKAIGATFRRRKTPLPATPALAFSDEFARDAAKRTQWTAFVRRLALSDAPDELAEVVAIVRSFLEPVIGALTTEKSFERHWSPSSKWNRKPARST